MENLQVKNWNIGEQFPHLNIYYNARNNIKLWSMIHASWLIGEPESRWKREKAATVFTQLPINHQLITQLLTALIPCGAQ